MGVYIRTGRSSGVSVPWIFAPFLMMGVATYWALWLTVMAIVWGVKFSVLVVRWAYAFAQVRRSRRDSERPDG